jgi:CubicO group peptidase (beta-lactamase class C family)
VQTVYDALTTPAFLVDRNLALGEISAECEVEEGEEHASITMVREVRRDLPAVLARIFDPVHIMDMTEEWQADEENMLRIDYRVCDYIPEFSSGGKHRISLRHVLAHRAGVPNLPPEATDVSPFFQCLLRSGEHNGEFLFAPRTVRHATAEQSYWELDLTLGFPVRYSLGFMLGNQHFGLLGGDNPLAFGHLGLSNIFTWADPARGSSVALLSTGKPILSPHVVPLFRLLNQINTTFKREFAEPPSEVFRCPSG